jgi:hypothetical protein
MSLDEEQYMAKDYSQKRALPEYQLVKREILISSYRAADHLALFIQARRQHKRLMARTHLAEFQRYVIEVYSKIKQKIERFCTVKKHAKYLDIIDKLNGVVLEDEELTIREWIETYYLIIDFNEVVLKITDVEGFSLQDPTKALRSGLTLG